MSARRDREQDLLDQLALGQISKAEFAKLWEELHADFYEAQMALRMATECEESVQ